MCWECVRQHVRRQWCHVPQENNSVTLFDVSVSMVFFFLVCWREGKSRPETKSHSEYVLCERRRWKLLKYFLPNMRSDAENQQQSINLLVNVETKHLMCCYRFAARRVHHYDIIDAFDLQCHARVPISLLRMLSPMLPSHIRKQA